MYVMCAGNQKVKTDKQVRSDQLIHPLSNNPLELPTSDVSEPTYNTLGNLTNWVLNPWHKQLAFAFWKSQ